MRNKFNKPIFKYFYYLNFLFILIFLLIPTQSSGKVNKGKHITSEGSLKALFVFVQFKDDSLTKSESWPFSTAVLPDWTQDIVNARAIPDFSKKNLSHYFYEMSQGKFQLIGDIYPELIMPRMNESDYKNIGEVNYEILSRLDDQIDYSKYDNWSKNSTGEFINEPDGNVDLIFVVYRNFSNRLFFNNSWTGSAQFYLSQNIKTNDNVEIKTGVLDKGSGIQSRGGIHGFDYLKYVLAHEFGHMLLGAGHIEGITRLGLMTGGPVWNASRGMHSWEREHLGWLKFTDIDTAKNSTILLSDYITTGQAARIKVSPNKWYVMENHQGISPNDQAADKGVYFYRVTRAEKFTPGINVLTADGNWNFSIDQKNKKINKTTPNRNGRNEINFSKNINKTNYACYMPVYEDNSAWGDETDAFDAEYNNIISPVSNPSSSLPGEKPFAISFYQAGSNNLGMNILFDNIYRQTIPSKPQILEINTENLEQPELVWMKNEEPDLFGYNIYYSISAETNRKFLLEFKENNSSSENKTELSFLRKGSKIKYYFFISATDTDFNESLISDFIWVEWDNNSQKWNTGRNN